MIKITCVESEIGRIECTIVDTLASLLKPKEYIYSRMAEELMFQTVTVGSYREAVDLLNRVLHRDNDNNIKKSTMSEHIVSQGVRIGEFQHNLAKAIFDETAWISEVGIVETADEIPHEISSPEPTSSSDSRDKADIFKNAIDKYNTGREDCDKIKNSKLINDTEIDPDECVYISIDDVGVKHQKDKRKDGGKKDGAVVENTVIHVQAKEGKYVITDVGMRDAFTLLMGFLISNKLLENRYLYFFSDGAQNIRSSIEEFFKPLCPYRLMLDWYHLEKRMTELLSMALKGSKEDRHSIRHTMDNKLWAGNFGDARKYLEELDPKYIKNQMKLDDAISYLERKEPYATCYALRKELGYRNSSNPAEKENDLVVATRQKHNGMSWSYTGSGALATITAVKRNGELGSWIKKKTIPFTLPSTDLEVAA